jgi:hypothetical protein
MVGLVCGGVADGGAGVDVFDASVWLAVPSRAGIKSVSQSAARTAAIMTAPISAPATCDLSRPPEAPVVC